MSLSHVAEDSALRNEDDATGYRTETTWLRLMPHEGGVAGDRRGGGYLQTSAAGVDCVPARRRVPMPLLLAIADAPEHEVRAELTHLQAAEFLYEVRLFPDLEYTFKHALTHEVA